MPEPIPGVPLDRKQLLIAGGIGLAVVAVIWISRRQGQSLPPEGFPEAPPEMGGGGGGFAPPMIVDAPSQPVADAYTQKLQEAELEAYRLQNAYTEEQMRQQRAQFELGQRSDEAAFNREEEAYRSERGLWEQLMPSFLRGEQARMGYEEEQFRSAQAAQEVVTRHTRSKSKVQCPEGEHFVVTAEGYGQCQPLGRGGVNPGRWLSEAGNAIKGVLEGVTSVAPQLGAGAAQAYAARQGVLSTQRTAPVQRYTPPIAPYQQPVIGRPYQFTGSTERQFPGLS